MANKERLIQVRDKILAHRDRFNYSEWASYTNDEVERKHLRTEQLKVAAVLEHNYNTCGCVAGWTYTCISQPNNDAIVVQASDYLDLTYVEQQFLFMGYSAFGYDSLDLLNATVENAIDRLNFLIERENDAQ